MLPGGPTHFAYSHFTYSHSAYSHFAYSHGSCGMLAFIARVAFDTGTSPRVSFDIGYQTAMLTWY